MKNVCLRLSLVAASIICLPKPSLASVYIQYYNKDSQKYVMRVQVDGMTKDVTFNGSTTGAATIQGSGKAAVVETVCGKN